MRVSITVYQVYEDTHSADRSKTYSYRAEKVTEEQIDKVNNAIFMILNQSIHPPK